MNNTGNKVSFGGLLVCALVSIARLAMYFSEVMFHDGSIITNYNLLNVLFAAGLAVTAAGFVLKFLGEKDIFDIIAAVALIVSVVFCISANPFNMYYALMGMPRFEITSEVVKAALENVFLLGLAAFFFKKGNKKHGKVLIFAIVYFAVGQIALNALFLDGGASAYLYFTAIYNSIVMFVTLLFTALTVVNEN